MKRRNFLKMLGLAPVMPSLIKKIEKENDEFIEEFTESEAFDELEDCEYWNTNPSISLSYSWPPDELERKENVQMHNG